MRGSLLAIGAALLAGASTAAAQGTALSGPTDADGASAWINPASMAADDGSMVEVTGGVLVLQAEYAPDTRPGSSSTMAVAPLVTVGGWTDALHPDWRLGVSVGIPRTAGGSWARDDPAGDITRYYLVSGTSFHLAATPAVSWTPVPEFTVGLGVNLVYANASSELDKDFGAQLNQTAGSDDIDSPFPYAHPDLAAPVNVEGDGFGIGGILGFLVRPIPELSFGTSVHTPVPTTTNGTLNVTYPERLRQFVEDVSPSSALPDLSADISMDLDIPLLFVFGVSAQLHEMVRITAQYRFEHLSSQPNFNLRVTETANESLGDTTKAQAYFDRHVGMLRVSVFPIPELRIAAFGNYTSSGTPEETTAPNNLDFHRVEVGLAARWRIVPELSVMLQYGHIFLLDNQVDESLHRPVTQVSLATFNHPRPTGLYTGSVDSVRLGVALHLE